MVVFLCPRSSYYVTTSNPDLLSSSETGVTIGIRSWKEHLSEWAGCQKAIGCICFTKKWKAETIQPGVGIWQFKTPAWKRYLETRLLTETVRVFGIAMIRVFWKKESSNLRVPVTPLDSPNFFSSHCLLAGYSTTLETTFQFLHIIVQTAYVERWDQAFFFFWGFHCSLYSVDSWSDQPCYIESTKNGRREFWASLHTFDYRKNWILLCIKNLSLPCRKTEMSIF
jgi:hypothetical protein